MESRNNAKANSVVSKRSRAGSLYRVIKAFSPIPYLIKARNFYIRSVSECAGRTNYNGLASGGIGVSMVGLPKSFSNFSIRNDDEFAELVKAASQKSNSSPGPQQIAVPRSFSNNTAPSVGRIDEDSPCYFPGSFRKNAAQPVLRYPRTRSFHPARTSRVPEEIVERT